MANHTRGAFRVDEELAKLPKVMVFFTHITMEAGEDTEFLDAMKKTHISGSLAEMESATQEGLKAVFKGFNLVGDNLANRLQISKLHGMS
ncbi:MAG TPA: hypothetical protein VH088_19150 [Terriglobales bacterium]|jgi:hypothetical protein|nr:hypothetical protein [Terriglobales bacterium]